MLNDVDYLLIAKPVTFNLLGIRHGCATLHQCYRSLVVLSEGHHLCCCLRQGEVYLKFVRSGNKAAWLLTSTCLVHDSMERSYWLRSSHSTLNVDELPTVKAALVAASNRRFAVTVQVL
jgi:hypothetical protein